MKNVAKNHGNQNNLLKKNIDRKSPLQKNSKSAQHSPKVAIKSVSKNKNISDELNKSIEILSSPIKNETDFEIYLESNIEKINQKSQRLKSFINLLVFMQQNKNQLRCFQHNNNLSLYCSTQHKIICVNCMYGESKHKTHKVVPLKNSQQKIIQDNMMFDNKFKIDAKTIETSLKNNQNNIMLLERQMKRLSLQAEARHKKKIDQLEIKYNQQISFITTKFKALIEKSRKLNLHIEQFKFRMWQSFSKVDIGKSSKQMKEETKNDGNILLHLFYNHMMELVKFDFKSINNKQLLWLSSKKIHQ